MPSAIAAGVQAGDPCPEDDDLAGVHARHAAEQHSPPAVRPLEVVRPGLRRHPPGDLGHRCEQRQGAVRELHGLVGHRGRPRGEQRVGALAGGGEVEVGEQDLVATHPAVLGGDGLLDLEHQVGLGPDVVGGPDDVGAGGRVLVVEDGRAGASVLLHPDAVAGRHELLHARRRDGHAVLVVLDLPRDPHTRHDRSRRRCSRPWPPRRSG
jgi:hypothetical protein